MATLFLRKKLPFLSSSSHHLSSTLAPKSSSSSPNFMAEYLITSCGFSQERAAKSSKRLSHVTSPSKPDSVVHFLKHHGFTALQIRTLVSNYPHILLGDAERTMEPNLRALRDMGFADHDLRELLTCNPQALQLASVVPRVQFWRDFLGGGDTKRLVAALTRNRGLLCQDVDKGIPLKVALLKEHGLSQASIAGVVVRGQGIFRNSLSTMESLLERVEGFGFPRGSPMFALALLALGGVRSDTLKAKMELYRSFGWSDGELVSAIKKFPFIVRLSEENVRAKMPFLVQKAGCTPGYIARYPFMLAFSLEKRLFPRHHVMQILTSNKLLVKVHGFYPVMRLTEKEFLETVVVPHNDKLPTLLETYIAARAGKIPLELYGEHGG